MMQVTEVRVRGEREEDVLLLPVEMVDGCCVLVGEHCWREILGVVHEAIADECEEALYNLGMWLRFLHAAMSGLCRQRQQGSVASER